MDEATFYQCVDAVLFYHAQQCGKVVTDAGKYKESYNKAEAAREILSKSLKSLLPKDPETRNAYIKKLEEKFNALFQVMFFDKDFYSKLGKGK